MRVEHESYFGWYEKWRDGWVVADMADIMNNAKLHYDISSTAPKYEWEYCAAFTVAELGQMLPISFTNHLLQITKGTYWKEGTGSQVWYKPLRLDRKILPKSTPAQKMLIYLLENGLKKPPEIINGAV